MFVCARLNVSLSLLHLSTIAFNLLIFPVDSLGNNSITKTITKYFVLRSELIFH